MHVVLCRYCTTARRQLGRRHKGPELPNSLVQGLSPMFEEPWDQVAPPLASAPAVEFLLYKQYVKGHERSSMSRASVSHGEGEHSCCNGAFIVLILYRCEVAYLCRFPLR